MPRVCEQTTVFRCIQQQQPLKRTVACEYERPMSPMPTYVRGVGVGAPATTSIRALASRPPSRLRAAVPRPGRAACAPTRIKRATHIKPHVRERHMTTYKLQGTVRARARARAPTSVYGSWPPQREFRRRTTRVAHGGSAKQRTRRATTVRCSCLSTWAAPPSCAPPRCTANRTISAPPSRAHHSVHATSAPQI